MKAKLLKQWKQDCANDTSAGNVATKTKMKNVTKGKFVFKNQIK